MRCSKCGTENPGSSSLHAERGPRFAELVTWLTLSALSIAGTISVAVPQAYSREESSLLQVAAAKFPNLTRAERAMLEFAQMGVTLGQFAAAGPSANAEDSSNDPQHANGWSHDRDVRASLIEWLCEDPQAAPLITGAGIRIMGARIVGGLDLSHVHVPFALVLRRCSIAERMTLTGTELPHLDLSGSYVGETDARGLIVRGDLDLADGFHASGETRIESARVEGKMNCNGGYFHYSNASLSSFARGFRPALMLDDTTFGSSVELCFGFRAEGSVIMRNASVATELDLFDARISNPRNQALRAVFSNFGTVYLGVTHAAGGVWGFETDGHVDFTGATVRDALVVTNARFLGAPGDGHGFFAQRMRASSLVWQNVELQNGAIVDLRSSQIGVLVDDEKSWPKPGNLLIDGLTYEGFGAGSPTDVHWRLNWIGWQPPAAGGFQPQPYLQLAKVYKRARFDREAIEVLVAEQDARYGRYGWVGEFLGGFLKYTIGYGHRPLLTVVWALAIIVVGWAVVRTAARANLMRPTYPENTPAGAERRYEPLHPMLYSIDVFFPFVNLHQEHYWWPDSEAAGEWRIFGRSVRFGSLIRYYLWFQIGAGWLLSAIFLAGVTGLIRAD